MKRIISLLMLVLPLCIVACTKANTGDDSTDGQTEYYVKYASEGLSTNYNVSYTDETGKKQSFSDLSGETFERVIGPVSVGFEAAFNIWVSNTNDTKTRAARIEVKKGNSPFVVKVEKSGKGSSGVSIKYTIE